MRVFLILLLSLLFTLPVMAAEDALHPTHVPAAAHENHTHGEQENTEQVYICPMHPHIEGKEGDRCPICGMDLVPQEKQAPPPAPATETETKTPDRSGALQITPAYRQALGVKTEPATLREFGDIILASGILEPQTRREHVVAVRTAGWVVDLKTDAIGDTVKKGDLLFTFYSPDLMTAQSDYLIGGRVGNAEQRLKLYGMDEQAIAALKAHNKFLERTPFYAPADGTVTTLDVRKGAYLGEGGTVLTLQDFGQLWVTAQVPVRDLSFLSVGAPATVTIEETGQSYSSVIDYIHPITDGDSRYGMARLVLDNPQGALKTGALVTVTFEAAAQKRLAVPEQAVLYGKDGGRVIADLGDGYFRPLTVKTGITAHGLTEIISGLKEGQKIVTAGQFMIDAESSLRGGTKNMDDMNDKGGGHVH